MSDPKRIQRQRTKGWRMPEGAVYVGRPTRWGNPFIVRPAPPVKPIRNRMWAVWYRATRLGRWDDKALAQADAIDRFRRLLRESPAQVAEIRTELAGRDLVCWCPLDQPCHADILLELANGNVDE